MSEPPGPGVPARGSEPSSSRARRAVLAVAVLLAAIAWRALICYALLPGWEARHETARFPDKYHLLARSLLQNGALGYGPEGSALTTVRGPGYPGWLALGMALGGDDPRWLGLWSGLPMILLAAAIVPVLGRAYGASGAVTAFLVIVCHPLPTFVSSRVLSDEFYAAVCFASLLVWDRALSSERPARRLSLAAVAGILLSIGLLTRATALLVLPAMMVPWAALARRALMPVALLLLISLAAPLAWSVRASALEGRPVFVHSLMGYNFWVGEGFHRHGAGWMVSSTWRSVLDLMVEQGGLTREQTNRFDPSRLTPQQAGVMEPALQRAALRRVAADPLGYADRVLRGVCRFWVQAQSHSSTLMLILAVGPVLVLAAAGGWGAPGRGDSLILPSLVVIALHNLVYAAILPMARFSVQIYPALGWLAAAGAAACVTWWARFGRGAGRLASQSAGPE